MMLDQMTAWIVSAFILSFSGSEEEKSEAFGETDIGEKAYDAFCMTFTGFESWLRTEMAERLFVDPTKVIEHQINFFFHNKTREMHKEKHEVFHTHKVSAKSHYVVV